MPRGTRPGRRNSAATLSISLSMLARTPGYCTLMARSRPSGVMARWTCPIEAAAKGRRSKRVKRPYQPAPHSAFSTVCNCFGGICGACARKVAMIAVISGGKARPVSIDSICPSFIAAPRIWPRSRVRRWAVAGVSSIAGNRGRSPCAIWRTPLRTMPPKMPEVMPPSRSIRSNRPPGTV